MLLKVLCRICKFVDYLAQICFSARKIVKYILHTSKGTSINDVPHFLAFFDLPPCPIWSHLEKAAYQLFLLKLLEMTDKVEIISKERLNFSTVHSDPVGIGLIDQLNIGPATLRYLF